ncbi:MAG: efflux RND transporter periplasmic adaptor subunit [Elusimicrobia bacterium]|nr:efflux RND transporter periplasmic adaptor subunit [Candidatus Obscuribacterium magneticum]MCB4755844.1 efflux RND transporter periplasmic adaptor subunit [Candidatus Obscuribacterium magneticum]
MKRKKRFVWIVMAALIAGGFSFWIVHKKDVKNERAEMRRLVAATEGPIEETVEATGEVSPLNRVEIKPPIQGRIEKLLVDEGENVKAGEIMAWMSSSDRAAILDAARAKGLDELKRWEDTYKPTPIIAPLSGVVILRNVVVGQTVDLSIVLYALSDRLIVVANVDEADIGLVHIGMPARITLDAYPGQSIDGRVFNILYEGKNVSNVITYDVKIEPARVPPFFRSQMTADVSLIIEKRENAVLVPSLAISNNRSGGKRVMVEGPDGKPVPRDVTTGIENGETTEIVSGLNAGESVYIFSKRYVPQSAGASSPLIMGGRPRSGSNQQPTGQGSTRQGQGGQRPQ